MIDRTIIMAELSTDIYRQRKTGDVFEKSNSMKQQTIVLIVMGILLLVLLFLSAGAHPEIGKTGNVGDYRVVKADSWGKVLKEDAPTGMIHEFRFTLQDVHHGETLAFFINHHNVEIYDELLRSC